MAKPTRKEIDAMIETCIRAVRAGRELTAKQWPKFSRMVSEAAGQTVISFKDLVPGTVVRAHDILIAAQELGLVKNKRHKAFLGEVNLLLRMETALLGIAHYKGALYEKGIRAGIEGKSLRERKAMLAKLSGMHLAWAYDRIRVLNLKVLALEDALKDARTSAQRQSIKRKLAAARGQKTRKLNSVLAAIRGTAAARAGQPKGAYKGGKREWDILRRYERAFAEQQRRKSAGKPARQMPGKPAKPRPARRR